MIAPIPLMLALWSPLAAQVDAAEASEPVHMASLVDNGDFTEELPGFTDSSGMRRIPWWVSSGGADQIETVDGRACLRTDEGEWARQPVAAYAPLVGGLVIVGEVRGRGVVHFQDGRGGLVELEVGGTAEDGFMRFDIPAERIEAALGRMPVPRFLIELRAGEGGARWRGIEARVPLPCPSESALRAEILAELRWIFALFLERSLDDLGPVSTAFPVRINDVITGEPVESLGNIDGGLTVVHEILFKALAAEEVPEWRAAFDAFVEDYLTRSLHPKTRLPRPWDPVRDVPKDDAFVEIAAHLRFLLDLAERGQERHRDRALRSALALGETVLAKGQLPNGAIAPKYRAGDGVPSTNVPHLRALDLPAELARLGALSQDERFLDAAREAVACFEYTHFWPGSWHEIDPGFDDNFGNFGARSLDLWRAEPEEPMFRRIAQSGYGYFNGRWRDALRLGGNVAADQVRCWQIFADYTRLEPASKSEIRELLRLAARSHFKGEQYGNGAWGDVTLFGFDPQPLLQVGDATGTPQNLVMGLAALYDQELGLRTEETRAMFTAVVRSTRAAYKRPFGYLSTRSEQDGVNLPKGSLSLAVGLVDMLGRL